MRTEVLSADEAALAHAAQLIRSGGLVAFPTETVYGLGADALNENAVKKIFLAKERPPDDPLIVHIAHPQELIIVAQNIPQLAWDLTKRFWPGPLTLVLLKAERVLKVVTGGLETVAVRMPAHPIARKLIEASRCPIAAPSANRFGRPSPTRAEHVVEDLAGRIDLILDGGPTSIGVESTVLDMTQEPPMVLRPGGVTLEELRDVLGEVRLLDSSKREAARRSPGTRYRHYAPRAKLMLVEPEQLEPVVARLRESGQRVGLMIVGPHPQGEALTPSPSVGAQHASPLGERGVAAGRGEGLVVMPPDLSEYARRLFAALRELDAQGVDVIVVEAIAERGLGWAIMDRLRRAARGPEGT